MLILIYRHLYLRSSYLLSSLCPGAKEQWSMKIVVNYEYGAFQRFDSIWDGSPSTDYDPNLNEHRANTQAEPNYNQLCYQGIRFDIKTDAPFLNMINKTDGRRETRRLPANYSPRLLGLSQVGSFIQLYVISTESGTCQSHHELKVVIFSTSYCELGGDTWCAYQGGPLTLTTAVPCSAKLPRMAIAPIDTDMMVLLDSNPQSGFLKCILVKPGQRLCSLGGDTLPKNRLENRYFFSTSSQKTLVQVHLMEHNSFVQYIIDQFGYVRLLYSSDNTEKNPQCPMLSPNIFNCTVGMKFWNGTKLAHLDGAVGEPQSFQRNGASGVVYVMQEGGESAVVVVHPLLSGGRQVLDNSTQVCRDSTAVKSVYVLGGGSVIVVAQCFPNGNSVFQVYLYQAKKACYELVPTRQPLQLKSGQSGKVLNILLIGHPFLVSPDAVNSTSALPPDVPSTITPPPMRRSSAGTWEINGAVVSCVLIIILCVVFSIIVCCCIRQKRKQIKSKRNDYDDEQQLIGDDGGHEREPDDQGRGIGTSNPSPGGETGDSHIRIIGNLVSFKSQSTTAEDSDSIIPSPSALPTSMQVTAEVHDPQHNSSHTRASVNHDTNPVLPEGGPHTDAAIAITERPGQDSNTEVSYPLATASEVEVTTQLQPMYGACEVPDVDNGIVVNGKCTIWNSFGLFTGCT